MSIFSRLALGTANFGKKYNGVKVSEDEQKRILDYCQCSGIDMIDTATAYEWDWTKISSYFNVVVKLKKDESEKVLGSNPYCVMTHNHDEWEQIVNISAITNSWAGISIYEPLELGYVESPSNCISVVQVPYSIFDRRFRWPPGYAHVADRHDGGGCGEHGGRGGVGGYSISLW